MRFISISSLVTVLAYVSLYQIQMPNLAEDPGVGWHLKTGEMIATTGLIPHVDPFLAVTPDIATTGGRRWVSDQWLSDLLLYGLKVAGGWPLIYVFFAGIWALLFFAVVAPGIRSQVGGVLSATFVALIAFKLGQLHFVVRPVVFSIFLFAITHRIARRVVLEPELSKGILVRTALALVFIFALWSNIHPAFILGLFVVFVIFPMRALVFGWNSRGLVAVCALTPLCVAATLCNPYGIDLHRSIFQLGSSAYFMSLNNEWRPTNFASLPGQVLLVMTAVPFVVWICFKGSRRYIQWFDLVLIAGMFCGCIKHVRFIPYAGIVAAYPCVAVLRSLRDLNWRALRLSRRFLGTIEQREAKCVTTSIAAGFCSILGFIFLAFPDLVFQSPPGPSEALYPRRLAQAIQSDAKTGVVFATPDLGGYITANLYPNFRAVIDDRNSLLGEQMYRRYFRAMESKGELQSLVDDFGVTHLVIGKRQQVLAGLRDSHLWPIIYEDEGYVVLRVVR